MHDPILGEDLLKLFTVPGSIIKEYNKNYTTFINIEIFPMWDGTLTSWLLVAGFIFIYLFFLIYKENILM